MNYFDIILNYLKVIINSWPLLILIILIVYRKQIYNLIERVHKGSLYGASFEFTPIIQKNEVHKDKLFNSPIEKAVDYFKNKPKEAFDEYVKIYKFFIFERAFHFIFGTQIRLLEYLEKREGNIEKREILFDFYDEYLKRTNPKLKRSTSQQYFAFLYSYKFIADFREDNQAYTKILDLGKDFLIYLRNQYSLIYINKPF